MDPSDNPVQPAGNPFGYQTRLLERTSSRSGTIRANRANSLSRASTSSVPQVPGPPPTQRWKPTHNTGNSLDFARSKWEDRIQAASTDIVRNPSLTSNRSSTPPPTRSPEASSSADPFRPSSPTMAEPYKTPRALKRMTMPSPIIASPLSPNTTGISVEGPDFTSQMSTTAATTPSRPRFHLPSPTSFQGSPVASPPAKYNRRTTTFDSTMPAPSWSSPSKPSEVASSSTSTPAPTTLGRRPTSLYGTPSSYRPASTPGPPSRPQSPEKLPTTTITPAPAEPSVMSPPVYTSSFMSNRKGYGDSLGTRKFGKHLPRIASGDGNDEEDEDLKAREEAQQRTSRREKRERRLREMEDPAPSIPPPAPVPNTPVRSLAHASPRRRDTPTTPMVNPDDVAGVQGRLKLTRDKAPPALTVPMPSSRLTRGLWVDTQRQHLQAYEYLCHVGEAQQWIEGCLGRRLEFGVVEMEEAMRNGVALAHLVRVFQGEGVVRRIYEAPKLDFRHSDNINYFFNFVREIGLPEGFIFELTDLYEKKNLPKVIYCIHALSHLLARRGMAERIGNLLGHLEFNDEQLQATQKGLRDAGVAMPNFGNVRKELAKDLNEEPEVEIESDDERRDRLLLENEESIIAVQCLARGFLVRKAHATQHVRIRLAERYVPKIQAQCRGILARRKLQEEREKQTDLTPWTVVLQARARGLIARNKWHTHLDRIRSYGRIYAKTQAQIRGVLQRRRLARLKAAMRTTSFAVTKLQSFARAQIARKAHNEVSKTFSHPAVLSSIVHFQALARGILTRRQADRRLDHIYKHVDHFTALQAHCRGVLMRRRMRNQMAKLEDVTSTVVRIQSAVRTYLARKRLLSLIRGLRKATPMLVGLQARARANLARQKHLSMNKALSEVKTVAAVGSFQARARAALARNKHRELNRRMEFAEPDVVGIQAVARGALVRRDYFAWRDHLHRSQPVATIVQAMLRGVLQRRKFRAKMEYYHANLNKIVKIQSLFRAKETREQYRQLTLGKNVTVGTIKNFVHLLDDSEADFQEEIKVERLRKQVVESIRENQALESEVSDLDVKIGLVVQNVKSFEEVIRARRRHGADSAAAHAARAKLLDAHGDPFAGTSTLDHAAKRKLELYQQLFYLLQTRGEYFSRLFVCMGREQTKEHDRRLVERVVLTLFGYGQDRREDYLLLKLFQLAIQEEIMTAPSIAQVIDGHPVYINVAVHYIRPKQITYVGDSFKSIIREVINKDNLDLEVDPTQIYKSLIDLEEMRSGVESSKPRNLAFYQALSDPAAKQAYISHLQALQLWTNGFLDTIIHSTRKMPFGIRYLARETLQFSKNKFPEESDEFHAACIGRLVYYRCINPAILTPETFDIVGTTITDPARRNLAQISKLLTQISSGKPFGPDELAYLPIEEFVRINIARMTAWFLEVANVPDAESQFHAHEFMDATVAPKPIYISPNEVYSMHTLLSQNQDLLAPSRDDTLRVILTELDGVPILGSDELKEARDQAITLELTNRFAHVRDPEAEEKALWVQAKRGVLAILRVQPAQDLVESLMRPVTDEDEYNWETILENEMDNENTRQHHGRAPSTAVPESAYRLEDIRSLSFKEVKAHAIFYLLELEKHGKITRSDGFQGILNAIAGDVRSKHRKRLQRQQEMENMRGALGHLAERKKGFSERIKSYHDYVEGAMQTMQRGNKSKRNTFVLPFTKQYYHLRDLQKSGKVPQYGSFKYSAKDWVDKRILLTIDDYSPTQYDKIDFIMSSNTPGVFTIEMYNNTLGITNRVATCDVKMEDLLQAQFESRTSLSLFKGMVKVHLETFVFQINKKFYV